MLGGGVTLNLPLHIVVTQSTMNADVSITSRLSPLFYLWGAPHLRADVLKQHQLNYTVLFSSSLKPECAWRRHAHQHAFTTPATGQQQYPLAVLVRGQFPDIYSGKERPAWPQPPAQPGMPPAPPAEEAPAPAPQPAPGKLLVVGNAQMLHRNFLGGGTWTFSSTALTRLPWGTTSSTCAAKSRLIAP